MTTMWGIPLARGLERKCKITGFDGWKLQFRRRSILSLSEIAVRVAWVLNCLRVLTSLCQLIWM